MAEAPLLVFTTGPLKGRCVRVPEGGLGVGRADDNAVVIDDEDVSRYHARFLLDNGTLWLQDAGSRNGLFVNDQRVAGHLGLKVGDQVRLATHILEVRWQEPEATAADTYVDDADTVEEEIPARRWFWPFQGG